MTAGTTLNSFVPELRNYVHNGNFDFAQRGTSFTVNGPVDTKTLDRWWLHINAASQSVIVQTSTDVPTVAQSNFQSVNSMLFTNNASSNVNAAQISHTIEGNDYQNLHAKQVRIQFWVKASISGTYGFGLENGFGGGRSYATTYTISNADTWQKINLDIQLDTPTANWSFNNAAGLCLIWVIGSTGGNTTSTLNTWQTVDGRGASGGVNWFGTNGATFQLAQVAVYPITASTGTDLPFVRAGKSVGHELQMCQRYCVNLNYPVIGSTSAIGSGVFFSTTQARVYIPFPVSMRVGNPSMTVSSGSDFAMVGGGGTFATSAAAVDSTSYTGAGVNFTVSGATAGQGTYARFNSGGGSPFILFDAEVL